MFFRRHLTALLALPLVLTGSGCLVTRMREVLLRPNELRRTAAFESSQGRRQFMRQASDDAARKREGASRMFWVPLLVFYDCDTVLSPNAYCNDQLAACDSDGDGLLTDEEVSDYVASRPAIEPDGQEAQLASDEKPGSLRRRRTKPKVRLVKSRTAASK